MNYAGREITSKSFTFRFPVTDKILYAFGTVMFAALACVSWVNQYGNGLVIGFLAFSALGLLVFLFSFDSITLTSHEVIFWRFFQKHRLAWTDIYEVIPDPSDSFSLCDRNGDVKIYVSSELKGYLELVSLIKQKRPELWQIQNSRDFHGANIFHRAPWAALYYGLGGIAMMLFALFFEDGTAETTFKLFARLLFFCIGFGLVFVVVRVDRKLEFSGSFLLLSYYGGWKKRVHIREVEKLDIDQEYYRTRLVNTINLRLKNGKMISFSGYKEGMPMLASAFETWIETYKAS